MLDNIELIACRYIAFTNNYHAGLAGVDPPDPIGQTYLHGLYDGKHFYTLMNYMKGIYGTIEGSHYFISDLIDDARSDEFPIYRKFRLYIIKYMSYHCCLSYLNKDDSKHEDAFTVALLERMLYIIKIDSAKFKNA